MDTTSLPEILKACDVPARKIAAITKEKATPVALTSILQELKVDSPAGVTPEVKANIEALIEIAGKFPADAPNARKFVLGYLMAGKLGSVQLEESIKYFKKKKDADFSVAEYEKECGIGVKLTNDEIKAHLVDILARNPIKEGDKKAIGLIWAEVKKAMPFTPAGDVSPILATLMAPKKKEDHTRTGLLSEEIFPHPSKNTQKTPEILEAHLKKTGGGYITRFPPEPNGYLHIGHAKSMNLNYGYAKKFTGKCIMRFDDTNPETEEQEYIDAILDTVKWMGHEWSEITYASNYFDQLYLWAVELIKRGKAYICHQTALEIEDCRKNHTNSPYRDRPIDENLALFEDMKNGKFAEGKATLRMKMDMQSGNSCMWDLIAYRIKFIPHHRTKDKWCIYPSYDFTHCLCDTIENITHSLCTLEFRMRRESYNWLVDALGLYRSVVFEFARLQLTHTILSKRKLITLVEGKHVSGWDDPRMSTLVGYRRRGYSSAGINALCDDVGVTVHNSIIPIEKLENFIRQDLNKTAKRLFAVFDPVKVTLKNWDGVAKAVKVQNVPGNDASGEHEISFAPFYIERSDFKEKDEDGYFGLALDKPKFIKLRYTNWSIKLVEVVKDAEGKIIELIVEGDEKTPCKNAIHWVAVVNGVEPANIEIREYDHLFLSEEPIKKFGKEWLNDLNPNSLVVKGAIIDASVTELKPYERVQFERVGYYCCDPDSKPEKFVFNKTVSLKESNWKKEPAAKK